jgi:hypothetical protein
VAATEAGVRFFLKGNCEDSLRPKILHLQKVEQKKNLRRSGRRFGPQSLNVAIKQMSYGSGFRAEAPAGKG